MKAYKFTGHPETTKMTNRLYLPEYDLLAATPTTKQVLGYSLSSIKLSELLTHGGIIEVDILDEKWVHPHLKKGLKEKLQ
jgi:hypothetical protein